MLRNLTFSTCSSPLAGERSPAASTSVWRRRANAGHRIEDFATLILEQARRAAIELKAAEVVVDDGLRRVDTAGVDSHYAIGFPVRDRHARNPRIFTADVQVLHIGSLAFDHACDDDPARID
jgi:hypothetical protein